MDLLESVKMAVTTLAANKLRSTLTMLGIIIGNSSVIAMIGVGQGAQRYAEGQFESLGPNVLFIVPGSDRSRNRTLQVPRTLVLEDAEAITAQVPTVKDVAPELRSQLNVTYQLGQGEARKEQKQNSLIVGTTPAYLSVRDFEVASGRFLSEEDLKQRNQVVVLGSELASNLFAIDATKNPQRAIGEQIRIRNLSFRVVGVLAEKGDFLGSSQDDQAIVPVTTMASRIVGRTSPYGTEVTVIALSAKNAESIKAAEFQIANLLRLRHKIVDEDDFTIRSSGTALRIIGNISGALTLMLAAIAGISLFVGGIGIMNIMLVSVTERTQEIGLRKAIGASQQDILIQFIIEALILSAVGGMVGTAVGAGGVMLIAALTPLQASVSPTAILLAVGVSGGIGLFFGVVPAKRAAELDPIVALRTA
ncbi:MAG: ABC transporter permease [Leptolyngbyaceae cyanobacterium bins.59]|nr:ABC transporter permease [Leptolyngbyaceae cyanobacterium bins.59]